MAATENPDQHRRPPGYAFASRNGATLLEWRDDTAIIAHRQGTPASVFSELRRYFGAPIELRSFGAEEFEQLLQQLYEHGDHGQQEFSASIADRVDLKQLAESLPEPKDLLESEDDAPIIRLINAILTEAIKENASDVHIEPFENRLNVRFRVDGQLREVLAPDRAMAPLVVSRIKVMAQLDIAEKRLPQDGRISLRIAGRPVDIRVSTLPSGHGERVVLRLLDKQASKLELEQLGLPPATQKRLAAMIERPHGIVLVTGPTGSGKTTTLYAALNKLNDRRTNIMTVEDPIEYFMDGIGQTQVNSKIDMSFSRGLRAILRQDPDVLMVGEIRDLETAKIAIRASQTGHLVLSTLHTNSAASAVARLRDMGVEPFMLASSLLGVLAQRLVRVICPNCRQESTQQSDQSRRVLLGLDADAASFVSNGCDQCRQSGYAGRIGIFELLEVDDEIRALIHDGAAESELVSASRRRAESLLADGRRKISAGITDVDEVFRVSQDG